MKKLWSLSPIFSMLLMVALASVTCGVGQAKAVTITFQSVSSVPQDFDTYSEAGFTFTPFGSGSMSQYGYVRVSNYQGTVGDNYAFPSFNFEYQYFLLTNDTHSPFGISSLDLINGVGNAATGDPQSFTITGTRVDSTTVTQTLTFADTHTRQTFILTDFDNLVSLQLGGGTSFWYASIDNLNLSLGTSAVPEPATMYLLALGLAVPAGFRWKFRKS